MRTATIYIIELRGVPSIYVGQTDCLERRSHDHLYNLRNGSHICRRLQRLYDEIGEASLSFRSFLECEYSDRHYYERMTARFFGDDRVLNNSLCLALKHKPVKRLLCITTGRTFPTAGDAASWLQKSNDAARRASADEVRRRISAVARGSEFSYAGTEWSILTLSPSSTD
jgi:hypothetical protein